MQVKILEHTTKPLQISYTAARTCYSEHSPIKLHRVNEASRAKRLALIDAVVKMGHHSILEHINISFGIENVSRVLSHQLVRHRVGVVFSQQSQRYVKFGNSFNYVVPPAIKEDGETLDVFNDMMKRIANMYTFLVEGRNIKPEDARFVIPSACCTNITMTVNARELIEMCKLRLCNKAQWEIREMYNCIITCMSKNKELEFIAKYLMPKCEWLSWCPEGKRTCGRKPTAKE